MYLPGMKLHTAGIIVLVIMTVHALSTEFGRAEHVIDHHALVEVFQTALVQCQLFVGDITWRDETVTQPRVDAVGRYMDVEGAETRPLATGFDEYLNVYVTALCFCQKALPFVNVEAWLRSADD